QVPINEGDSGGPVVDSRGVLVGLNAMGSVGQNNSGHIDVSEISDLLKRYFHSIGKDWSPAEPPQDAVAEKHLLEVLHDLDRPDARARLYAVDALGKFTRQGREAARALVRALDDPHVEVRRSATEALGRIGWAAREEVFAGLIKAVKDKERTVRVPAVLHLARL